MKFRQLALIAFCLVASAVTSAQATAQVPFLPGLSDPNMSMVPERVGYSDEVGIFLVDTETPGANSRAIIRTVQVNAGGQTTGPILIHEKEMKNLMTVLFYGRLGYLFEIDWTGHPAPDQMPRYFFISAHSSCGHQVYSYRPPMFRWRFVGTFVRTPLDSSVTP